MSIETYLESAKQLTTQEEACQLIKEVTENQQIFVFGELLELPLIQSLKQQPNLSRWYNLLELFAYGKVSDYNEQVMPVLSDLMIKKLRLLTIVTLATNKVKKIPYSVLGEELKVVNLRDLEDLIIEAIYANLIKGKLDQKAICLEVESTLARDVRLDKIDDISGVLSSWITNCEGILTTIERQTKVANSIKSEGMAKRAELEEYINTSRKTIKASNVEMDDNWELNSMQHHHEFEKSKRGHMHKATRASLKSRNHRF